MHSASFPTSFGPCSVRSYNFWEGQGSEFSGSHRTHVWPEQTDLNHFLASVGLCTDVSTPPPLQAGKWLMSVFSRGLLLWPPTSHRTCDLLCPRARHVPGPLPGSPVCCGPWSRESQTCHPSSLLLLTLLFHGSMCLLHFIF